MSIYLQGRNTWFNPMEGKSGEGGEEDSDEEERNEPDEPEPEVGPPLLTPVSEDQRTVVCGFLQILRYMCLLSKNLFIFLQLYMIRLPGFRVFPRGWYQSLLQRCFSPTRGRARGRLGPREGGQFRKKIGIFI